MCICSYQFNFRDFCKYYELFNKEILRSSKIFKKNLKDTIKNKWKSKCFNCLQPMTTKNQNEFCLVIFKDMSIKNIFHLDDFKHICCSECLSAIKKLKNLDCCMCGLNHKIIKIKEDLDDDDCIVY